jgi:hypothetical protein
MKRNLLIAAAGLSLAACVTPASLQVAEFEETRDEVKVLVMAPNVEVVLMTTTGPEPRADWTEAARDNLLASVSRELEKGGEQVIMFDPEAEADADVEQALLLNDSVTATIRNHVGFAGSNTLVQRLPHREGADFSYTIGDSISGLTADYDADYALFLTSNASFNSSGVFFRNMAIAAATLGNVVIVPINIKGTFATLVDMETGDIVWVDGISTGDPRDPAGADQIMSQVFQKSPLK